MGKWLIPFRKRERSGGDDVNCLWKSNRLYVMDNHRAAYWCWMQHINESEKWKLFHVDYHYDMQTTYLPQWLQNLPEQTASLDEYLGRTYRRHEGRYGESHVINWGNYLAIFLAAYKDRVEEVILATARFGDKPKCQQN